MEWALDAMATIGFFIAALVVCIVVSALVPESFLERLVGFVTTIFLIACLAVFVYRCAH